MLSKEIWQQPPLARHIDRPEIPQYSPETTEALKKKGYKDIYNLTGSNIIKISSVRAYMDKIYWNDAAMKYLEKCLDHSWSGEPLQVAINSDELIIPKSNNKLLFQQKKLINKSSNEQKIIGAQNVILEASQILELFLTHWDKTGEYLTGKNFGNPFVRSSTMIDHNRYVSVGWFKEGRSENSGIHLRIDPPDKHPNIFALNVLGPA